MRISLVYSHPVIYEALMAGLYGRHYEDRYRAVAGLIAPGSSVLDLCCGPGVLYHRHLRAKAIRYTGWDCNRGFIAYLARRGAEGEVRNICANDPFPVSDYVVMQGSLYHFLPDASGVIKRMIRAARRQVIISEPVRNLATSRRPWLSWLAKKGTAVDGDETALRFTAKSLEALLIPWREKITRSFFIPGGREQVYVIENR
jgi:SAM-dependent methyltransferase